MTAPRFPYLFPRKGLDARAPKIVLERNRCIQCLRCVRGVLTKDGKKIFAAVRRGPHVTIEADIKLTGRLSEEEARQAMDLCPVGAILKKEVGFAVPIGHRKFDKKPIGIENQEKQAR
jgi:[NiFe] hydrogenase diaphorase moiety small subunit